MPEDSKKNNDKKKHEPKEQRKTRHSRNHAGKSEKKAEKPEEIKPMPKVPQKPVYEDPGPEFYKNLKRETEEIVKITEAENAKYKKKEIQSNWAKYEMPIESYDDIDEQDIGADYEKLIQAPLSAGGHFQFKHEKSWDTSSAPSHYDKYFEIKMDSLATAISSIPFYERNDIDKSLFSQTDLISMNNRASKYKMKYFNDKTYSTTETDAQDKIIKSLKDNLNVKDNETKLIDTIDQENTPLADVTEFDEYDVNLDFKITKIDSNSSVNINEPIKQNSKLKTDVEEDDFHDEINLKDMPVVKDKHTDIINNINLSEEIPPSIEVNENNTTLKDLEPKVEQIRPDKVLPKEHAVTSKVNPVIESPEDLEKWLDDFLDS